MSDLFFSGTWYGQYSLGKGYGRRYEDVSTSFEISITVKDGVLHGICIDDPKYVPLTKPAMIEGFIEGAFISFIKKYAHAWSYDDKGGIIEYPDQTSHEIHYTGHFTDGGFKGEWEIGYGNITNEYGNTVQSWLKGTWTMQHASDL